MEPAAGNSPSPSSSNFAGLLSSLTSPAKEEADQAVAWSDIELGDDVVTLSYERALRNHARYRPADIGESRPLPAVEETVGTVERTAPAVAIENGVCSATQAGTAPQTAPGRDLRTSSVTIRLSDAECARVRQRAAEAGLTVSAYLRSCVLEAEALRAQVKEALADLKTAAGAESAAALARRSRLGWIWRLTKRKG